MVQLGPGPHIRLSSGLGPAIRCQEAGRCWQMQAWKSLLSRGSTGTVHSPRPILGLWLVVGVDSGPWKVSGDQVSTVAVPQARGRKAGDAGAISKEGCSQLCCWGEQISSPAACSACTLVLPKA